MPEKEIYESCGRPILWIVMDRVEWASREEQKGHPNPNHCLPGGGAVPNVRRMRRGHTSCCRSRANCTASHAVANSTTRYGPSLTIS